MTASTLLEQASDPQQADDIEDSKTLDDLIFEQEVKLNSFVFDEQTNFAAFYSFVKLREQEIRNIVWMAEMISRKIPKESALWQKYIVPFADSD
jgi:V-type H+-transporting ATPase subunit d